MVNIVFIQWINANTNCTFFFDNWMRMHSRMIGNIVLTRAFTLHLINEKSHECPLVKMHYQHNSRYLHMLIWNLWLLLLECVPWPSDYWPSHHLFIDSLWSYFFHSYAISIPCLRFTLPISYSHTLYLSPLFRTLSTTSHSIIKIALSHNVCNPHCWSMLASYSLCLNIYIRTYIRFIIR